MLPVAVGVDLLHRKHYIRAMSRYSEDKKTDARKAMTAWRVEAQSGRNAPIALSELRYRFTHGDECSAVHIGQAPASGYAVSYWENLFTVGGLITQLDPIAGLWGDVTEALRREATEDRARKAEKCAAEVAFFEANPEYRSLRLLGRSPPPTLLPEAIREPEIIHSAAQSYNAYARTCDCGAVYLSESAARAKRWCSDACRETYAPRKRAWINRRSAERAEARAATPAQQCAHCGKTFTPPRSNARFCSTECRVRENSLARSR